MITQVILWLQTARESHDNLSSFLDTSHAVGDRGGREERRLNDRFAASEDDDSLAFDVIYDAASKIFIHLRNSN